MDSIPMLILLVGFVVVAGVDAIKDRTPRKPWAWARPPLEFWAQRRSHHERARTAMPLSSERTAQILSPASPSQEAVA
jgi:hypothetical protein